MENLKKETSDATVKGIRNLFRLEKENEEIKDIILKDIRNLFRLGKENKVIKDIILRDIRNYFENEEEDNYYKPVRQMIFGVTIILNKIVTMIEIKQYQLKNILIKLDPI